MKQQSFSCWMKYFLYHMDKIRANASVLKNLAEKCIFSLCDKLMRCQTKEKPINHKCVETFFNLFNNLYAIKIRIVNWGVTEYLTGPKGYCFSTVLPLIHRGEKMRFSPRSFNTLAVARFLSIWYEKYFIRQLKLCYFIVSKNYVHLMRNARTIAY